MDYPAQRRERLERFVVENDLDGFLVTKVVNVSYLTNFSGDSSYLLVGRDRTMLVSDGRYTTQLGEECPGLPLHIRPPEIRITPAAAGVLKDFGWKRVGFESGHVTVAEAGRLKDLCPTVQWKPCEDVLEGLREIKDAAELEAIRESIGMAERAFTAFRASLQADDTEKQLSDRMELLLREEGATCSAFPTIVAVGPRAALPHAPPSGQIVGDTDVLLVDWGATGRFYKSDLTRVLAPRKISPKLEQVYEVVLRAQERAIRKIRPGIRAQDVDAEARAALAEAGFGDFFSHGLGHGFGLEIHEAPQLRPKVDTVLQPGMVCTVEPGVYLPEWGGVRIEDDVLITPDGYEVLTHLDKDLRAMVVEF